MAKPIAPRTPGACLQEGKGAEVPLAWILHHRGPCRCWRQTSHSEWDGRADMKRLPVPDPLWRGSEDLVVGLPLSTCPGLGPAGGWSALLICIFSFPPTFRT